MVFFQSSEQRKRHAFIDTSIGNYTDVLSRNLREDGHIHPTKVENDQYIIDHLTVPNLRHGTLALSRRALRTNDYIPIWPLLHGESVTLTPESSFTLHPIQHQNAITYFRNRDINFPGAELDIYLEAHKAVNNDIVTTAELSSPKTAAFVRSTIIPIVFPDIKSKNQKREMHGRPHIFLAMNTKNSSTPHLRAAPDVIAHEFTHVIQNMIDPVRRHDAAGSFEDTSLRNELIAYNDQEYTLNEMHRQGYMAADTEPTTEHISKDGRRYSGVYLVNNLRRETNQKRRDKFFPDGKLRKKLLELGLGIHYSLPPEISRHHSLIENGSSE